MVITPLDEANPLSDLLLYTYSLEYIYIYIFKQKVVGYFDTTSPPRTVESRIDWECSKLVLR